MTTVLEVRPVRRLSDAVSIRRQFPIFARRKLHYLDSAATAQVPKSVAAAVELFDLRLRANVYGGVYGLARDALSAYEQSRQDVARFLGANSTSEVVFTYGTTSSLNLLASSFGEQPRGRTMRLSSRSLSITATHCHGGHWRAGAASSSALCR